MVRLRRLIANCAIAASLFASPGVRANETDKFGEWHFDAARSELTEPPPQADVRIYEDAGEGFIRSIHRIVSAGGEESVTTYVARADGTDYPLYDAAKHVIGTIALSPDSPKSQTFVTKRNGILTARGKTTISPEGEEMTMVIRIYSAANSRIIRTVFKRIR